MKKRASIPWLLRRIPKGGCLLVFNGNVHSWSACATKHNTELYKYQVHRLVRTHTAVRDLYIQRIEEDIE